MRNKILFSIISFISLLSGCTIQPVAPSPIGTVPPASNTPMGYSGWSQAAFVAQHLTPAMLKVDLGDFCPKQAGVDRSKAFALLVESIAYAESGLDPKDTYIESAMGTDPITGKQVESDGYLQLSYQDKLNWKTPTCQQLDYSKGNIFDPAINLGCGMEIMDRLAQRSGPVSSVSNLGAYWSTVRIGHQASRTHFKKLMPECS